MVHRHLRASRLLLTRQSKPKTKNHRRLASGILWWTVPDLNRRPPRCKRGALPTKLTALGAERNESRTFISEATTGRIPKGIRPLLLDGIGTAV